jgi:hypothetical protein
MAKKITITIESTSLLVFRGRISGQAWCDQCAAETEAVALDNTAASNHLRSLLERWFVSEELHRLPSSGRSPLVCLRSLLARTRKPPAS